MSRGLSYSFFQLFFGPPNFMVSKVSGIPVGHQHLLYNMKELEDSACLMDYSIQHGATLKLVLSVRGGPVSTRRLPPVDDLAWRELQDLVENNREEMLEHLPPGCQVTVLLFREGDQVNLFRVVENEDGSYSPLSQSWNGTSLRNLFAEEDSEVEDKRLQENSVTMGKVQDLRAKMEKLSLQKKPKKSPRVLSGKKSLQSRRGTPCSPLILKPQSSELKTSVGRTRTHKTELVLPPIGHTPRTHGRGYLENSSLIHPPPLPPRPHNHLVQSLEHDISKESLNSLHLPRLEPRRVNRNLSNVKVLPDVQRRSSVDYGCNKSIANSNSNDSLRSLDEENLGKKSGLKVLTRSNLAILEDENRQRNTNENFLTLPRRISIPSIEESTLTLSSTPEEKVGSAVNDNSTCYRVARLILDEDDRPKTSPDELIQRQKATQGLCDILNESKWPLYSSRVKNQRRKSQVDLPRNLTGNVEDKSSTKLDVKSLVDGPFLEFGGSRVSLNLDKEPPRNVNRGIPKPAGHNMKNTRESTTHSKYQDTELFPQRLPRRRLSSAEKISVPQLPSKSKIRPFQKETGNSKKPLRTRCAECRKRLNITNIYSCRCDKLFCSAHRHSESHNCSFDYKSEGRKILEQANPLVAAPKLPKI
uniref:AN1-type zinc finger protein 4 n=1 Tax=Timema cristinae TaxID=61476 RepID=A0A7R9D7V0_TIMCR|nr:unnamed protein product [Timema cristinae]